MTKKKTNISKKRPRTYSRNRPKRSKFRERLFETDSTYFLKLVVIFLIGTFWLKFQAPVSWLGVVFTAFPVGLCAGLLLVRYLEKHQSDRKIWYAVLLFVTVISYFGPAGIVI